MSRSSLGSANRYLKNPAVRRALVLRSVATSSAVEGIHAPFKKGTTEKKTTLRVRTSPKKR